jgi:4-hydroxybenzoate polyprenyltransferase
VEKGTPLCAGAISIPEGLLASFLLLTAALGFGFFLDIQFGCVLLAYAALTMLYSLYLKKIALLDVFVLSSFYSFRILAGALISETPTVAVVPGVFAVSLFKPGDGETIFRVARVRAT